MKYKNFPCTSCGACCRRIGDVVTQLRKKTHFDFPYQWDENGVCEMLNPDNTCAVYDDRPLICNIDKTIKMFDLNKDEAYRGIIKSCNSFMIEDNMPEEYLIPEE